MIRLIKMLTAPVVAPGLVKGPWGTPRGPTIGWDLALEREFSEKSAHVQNQNLYNDFWCCGRLFCPAFDYEFSPCNFEAADVSGLAID